LQGGKRAFKVKNIVIVKDTEQRGRFPSVSPLQQMERVQQGNSEIGERGNRGPISP